jgi:hypothetical protein
MACWREVVLAPRLGSRHYLQAWHFLREFGQPPPPDIAKQVLGVVVEFGGLDLLATYADRLVLCYNFYAAGAQWERQDNSLDPFVDRLLAAAAVVVAQIEPLKTTHLPPPEAGQIRLSFLTPSGPHVKQGSLEQLQGPGLTGPAMQAATRLLQAIKERANHRI